MRKRIIYVIIIVVLLLTGCTIGGSFYMLNFSLTPDAKILSKDADSYPYMYRNYPFLRPWVDSLRQATHSKILLLSIRTVSSFMHIMLPPLNRPTRRQ